jgi:leucyl/phenylalanyl-tRNA--protein transferase
MALPLVSYSRSPVRDPRLSMRLLQPGKRTGRQSVVGGEPVPTFEFPDPREADSHGVVAVGGGLDPAVLMSAYRRGVFPWPVEPLPMLWFCPAERGVLDFGELHLPRSLARARRRTELRFTIDQAFSEVIRSCARVMRPGQDGTWITPEIVSAYTRLHELGVAHSAEAWNAGDLVGGLYGVDVDGAFAAESMFYVEANASKLALLHLIDHLRSLGLDWLDIQVLTPHLARIGAKSISRDAFLRRLAATRARHLTLFPARGETS